MNLYRKMTRCKKAAYGFEGSISGVNFFNNVERLKDLIGPETEITDSVKYPGIKVPNYQLELQPAHGWSTSGPGSVGFKLYVNDEAIAVKLTLTLEAKDAVTHA